MVNQDRNICFTGLHATRSEIKNALLQFYEKHPENRIDFKYLEETGMMNPESMNRARGNPARTDSLEREYFNGLKDHLKPDGSWGERWRLKTSDGKVGFSLSMEFCDPSDQEACNLCLVGQLRKADMDGSRKDDFQFSKKEEKEFVAYLERDLIKKLRVIIEEARDRN